MSSNNVISFVSRELVEIKKEPKHKLLSNESDIDEVYNETKTLSAEWSEEILDILFDAGFIVDEEYCQKDSFILMEAIESIISRNYGIYHPFQDIADRLVNVYVEGDIVYVDWKSEEDG